MLDEFGLTGMTDLVGELLEDCHMALKDGGTSGLSCGIWDGVQSEHCLLTASY
jgi:hypothetical protein